MGREALHCPVPRLPLAQAQRQLAKESYSASRCHSLMCFCWTQAGDGFQMVATEPAVTLVQGMVLAELLSKTVTIFFCFLPFFFFNLDNAVCFLLFF